jgi:hypothetical protein
MYSDLVTVTSVQKDAVCVCVCVGVWGGGYGIYVIRYKTFDIFMYLIFIL